MMKRLSTVRAVKGLLYVIFCISLSTNGIAQDNIPDRSKAGDTLQVLVTGDLLLDRGVRQRISRTGIDRLFTAEIDSLFHASDRVIANLECPVTEIRERVYKRFIFRGDPEWLPALRHHGITHLDLANNHSIDQGRRGLTDTQWQIRQAGMTPLGAGRSMADAARPVLLASHPRRIWVLCSLRLPLENFPYLPDKPSVSQESFDSLTARVSRLRTDDPHCCILILLHWGWEHHLRPIPRQRQEARRLIDAGADAVIGHHSHTLQTIETYKGKPIYYGIGNFIFDQHRPLNSRACLVRLAITADSCLPSTFPIEIRDCVPHLLPTAALHGTK